MTAAAAPAAAQDTDPENTIYMDVPAGRVVIELLPDVAKRPDATVRESEAE